MTRLHAGASSAVEVRTRSAPAGPVPDQFRWRGRVYLVLEVLSRWTESGGWWRGAAVAALTSGDAMGAPAPAVGPTISATGPTISATAPTISATGPTISATGPTIATHVGAHVGWVVGAAVSEVGVDDRVQQWWRVEAASGRTGSRPALSSAGPGVYDLCFDQTTSGWSLTRVQD